MGVLAKARTYLNRHGARWTLHRLREKLGEKYLGTWDRAAAALGPDADELAAERTDVPDAGLISVLIPVYNTRPDLLTALAESLTAQTYENWEACLFSAGDREDTREALRRAAAMDHRIRVRESGENGGIAANTNQAFAMSRGGWVALCDHDDLLTPDALWRVAKAIAENDPDVVYTDEDKVTENGARRTDPHFKPDFCPDNLRSSNYICHLMAVRRTLMEEVGGERPDFDGSQDHDLALRLAERTDRIVHVPHICYHWRTVGASMSHQHLDRCTAASCRAVEEHTARLGYPCRATAEDGVIRLRYRVPESLRTAALVLCREGEDAGSLVRELERQMTGADSVLTVPFAPGGRNAAMDEAVRRTDADLVLVVDSSVRGLNAGFVGELKMYAQRRDVGMVTPALTDDRGRITHAGFAVGTEGAAQCRNLGLRLTAGGWHDLARQSHNVSAVSPACAMFRRDHWRSPGEGWRSALGWVDLCLSMQRAGLRHVYTPHAAAVCTDSGLLLTGAARDPEDERRFLAAWPDFRDPCMNPNLNRKRADFTPARP